MSGPTQHRKPPAAHQFRKGRSGNPKGRPKKQRERPGRESAFELLINRTLTVTQGGRKRELTIEEALQLKTLEEALAGNRPARREVLKMIAKREQWLAKQVPAGPIPIRWESKDPRNADQAMLLLGIAEHDPRHRPGSPDNNLMLAPWAVQAALGRRGLRALEEKEVEKIKALTRDSDSLRWPSGIGG